MLLYLLSDISRVNTLWQMLSFSIFETLFGQLTPPISSLVLCRRYQPNQRSCSAEVFSWNSPLKAQERGSESEVLLLLSLPWKQEHGRDSCLSRRANIHQCRRASDTTPPYLLLRFCTGVRVSVPSWKGRGRELQWPVRFTQRSLSPHCQRTQQAATKKVSVLLQVSVSLSEDAECVAAPGEPRMIKMTFRVFSLLVNSNRNRSGSFLTDKHSPENVKP